MSAVTTSKSRWDKLDTLFGTFTVEAAKEMVFLCKNEGVNQRDPEYITQQSIADRYGLSQQSVSNMISVGADKRVTSRASNSLPKAQYSLYLLTTLPDDDFEYVVEEFGEQVRRDDILAVKAGFDTVEEWAAAKAEDRRLKNEAWEARERLIADWRAAEIEDKERFPDPEPEPEVKPKYELPAIGSDPKRRPEEFLIEQFRILMYSHNEAGQKAAKAMFASLYHSDQPKLRTDTELLAQINLAFTTIKELSK